MSVAPNLCCDETEPRSIHSPHIRYSNRPGSHRVLYENRLQFSCSVIFDITGYMDTYRLLVYSIPKQHIVFSC